MSELYCDMIEDRWEKVKVLIKTAEEAILRLKTYDYLDNGNSYTQKCISALEKAIDEVENENL